MTSASELFYNRRSRLGRNTPELVLDPPLPPPPHLDRNPNHTHNNRRNHHSNRRDRHDPEGCDPLRRSPQLRLSSHRPSRTQEQEPVGLDQGGSQSGLADLLNSANISSIHNRPTFSGRDRLPGAVLLARERLLERLRGVSVSRNRRSNRSTPSINHEDSTYGDNFRLVDVDDWESEISPQWQPSRGAAFTDQLLVPEETSKRPPGLSKEALNCLQLENFSDSDKNDEARISGASEDCSICLERFVDGDELICLPCRHRFHSCCLDPWVRACGDCPNCRTGIVIDT